MKHVARYSVAVPKFVPHPPTTRAPFYSVNIAQDVSDFLEALEEINGERKDVR